MAVTPARLGKLRLNAGRLAYVAPTVPSNPNPPHLSLAGPLTISWSCTPALFEVYFGTTTTPPLVGTTRSFGWVLAPLTIGTVYYWKIIATANGLGPAQAGPVWSFTATAPVAPIYLAPANGAINQTSPVTLSWSAVAGIDIVYDVYFGTVAKPPRVGTGQSATTFTTGALADGTDYYWRIAARNNAGAVSGPTWTFETRNPTKGLITIGGVDVRARVRIAGIAIRDLLADTPNTATFTIEGTAPTVGQEVRIGLASLTGDDVLFGGIIDTVDAMYEGRPENHAWRVTAQDYVYGMNRRKVRRRYGQASATAIAHDLLTLAPAGLYTGTHIAAGLPIVSGGIDFTEEDLTTCFARLAQRIGGYWYVDYARDVHLFLTEASEAPTAITRAARVLLHEPGIHWSTDLSQIRTRVFVEGGGSSARALVAPGATVLPVTDGSWYSPSGGLVVSGPQRIAYTGKAGVGGGVAPAAAPVATAGNLGAGPYRYVTTTINAGNESPISAPSNAVTLPAVAGPSTALVLTPTVGQVAAPAFAPTLTPISTQVAAPSTAPTAAPALPMTGQITSLPNLFANDLVDQGSGTMHPGGPGYYTWQCTFTNARGEGPAGNRLTFAPVQDNPSCNIRLGYNAAPAGEGITGINIYRQHPTAGWRRIGTVPPSPGGTFVDTQPDAAIAGAPAWSGVNTSGTPGAGHLTPGAYQWRVVFVAANGETNAGPTNAAQTIANAAPFYTAVQLSNVPISGDPRVVARRIYRTTVNGGAFKLETTINDNTTTTYLSEKSDASLGAALANVNATGTGKLAPGAIYGWQVAYGTSSGETLPSNYSALTLATNADTVDLSNIPISGDARVTKRKIYRTAAGGGAFRLEATINDNTTTTYRSGAVTDGALGANPPATNTTGSGGLTPGAWYAWTFRYVTSTGGETDIAPLIGVALPAGADTVQLAGLSVSPDSRVTKRRIYRTVANGATPYKLEAEITDNTTTTYTSTKTDAQLGADLVQGNTTSAGGQVSLSGIEIGSAGTTARKIYRTASGGAAYLLAATLSNNTATTYQDNASDASLGAGAPVDEVIQLVGIPASGPGAVLYEIRPGEDVNLFVQCDDPAAQAALAAIEGGGSTGVVEHVLQDRRLGLAEATATGKADLALFARPLVTIDYATRDPNTRSGKSVHIDLPDLSLVGDFTIQTVEITEIDTHPGLHPQYRVTCSSVRFSFEDAVRRMRLDGTE